ncbi:TraC family protein [Loktanella sp. Alg231-35]|uniref:TraC family protein n=1 Tax=Loktanella sp. Alg231-35 TaxID=1922220 RepID=UPI000D557168|nr:TraC family protein [Loktanella sp. Alg231-35]
MGGFANFMSSLFDDAPFTMEDRQSFVDHVFSDLLSYRVYDPEDNLFHNDGTVGFLLETPPVIGADVFRTLQTAISSYCPPDGTVQFISWASPNLMPNLTRWSSQRHVQTPLMRKMVERRIGHFNGLRFGTNGHMKCVPHSRRILISGWVDGDPSQSQLKGLKEFRRNLILAMGGDQLCANVQPSVFLELLSEMLHTRGSVSAEPLVYDDDVPLNYQLPGAGLAVASDGMSFLNSPELSVSSATVRMVPHEWAGALGSLFNGSPDRPDDNPHGPVLTCLTARSKPNRQSMSEVVKKRAKLEHAKTTNFGKWMSDLPEQDAEYEGLQTQLERGERIFETLTTVSAYARGDVDDSTAALSEMRKIYSMVGVTLEKDNFLQLPVFLAGLPFQASGPRIEDMRKASRVKKRKGAAVTALAPIHGEFVGAREYTGLLLCGRQGQLCDWDNYRSSGNYNVSVVGKSGAGKSVFMQELVTSIYSGGGRVLVIDDGQSFKTTCEIIGGDWLSIGSGSQFRLNPFAMLSAEHMDSIEYRGEALELITRVIATMANLGEQREGRVSGIEEEFIELACAEVWDKLGNDGNVTEVLGILKSNVEKEPRLIDVITKLSRYAVGGTYGEMFDGPSNVSIDSAFTVFEMSELKSQKDLEAVVLQIIMFLGTELMFKTDRSTRVAILIDEAWDMLGAETAKFLEGVVRRARKYTGALITGTQSMLDYYENPAALVCLQNSDWTIFLSQKPEVIDQLVSDGRLNAPEGIAHSLKSLTSVKGQFSECGIRGPEGWLFGRLLLDKYSLAIFSTTGHMVQKLNDLVNVRGMNMGDALEQLVESGEVI